MFEKRNLGFTLVELLAVIAILGMIAVIVIPSITKIIARAEKETFETKVRGIMRSTTYEYKRLEMTGEIESFLMFNIENGIESSNVDGAILEYDGDKIKNGKIIINDEGKVAFAIYNDDWCATKNYSSNNISVTTFSDVNNCQVELPLYVDKSGAYLPSLGDGIIPIKWAGTKWVKADISQEWYNYDKKEWANAVLVKEETRDNYIDAKADTDIIELDVLAYLVWIPRYRYKLFNVEFNIIPEQTIEIEFENGVMDKSTGTTNGTWLTHPAFTFGNDELEGFWISKFEITGSNPWTSKSNKVSKGAKLNSQFSLIKYYFDDFQNSGVPINYDAHMIKSMEWGAVTYLSLSRYGKNSFIWKNPSKNYITGCAGDSKSASDVVGCPYVYTTENGQQASTTGNLHGVYDMSGGTKERVMGGMYNTDNTNIIVEGSGFDPATIDSIDMEKYIDKYQNNTDNKNFSNSLLGDAIGEIRKWYSPGTSYFIYESYPWLVRGGYYWKNFHGISFTDSDDGVHYSNSPASTRVIISGKLVS